MHLIEDGLAALLLVGGAGAGGGAAGGAAGGGRGFAAEFKRAFTEGVDQPARAHAAGREVSDHN